MATNRRQIDAPPEGVCAVLSDADCYAHWVVGSRDARDADPRFPAEGTSFHHSVALGPLDATRRLSPKAGCTTSRATSTRSATPRSHRRPSFWPAS